MALEQRYHEVTYGFIGFIWYHEVSYGIMMYQTYQTYSKCCELIWIALEKHIQSFLGEIGEEEPAAGAPKLAAADLLPEGQKARWFPRVAGGACPRELSPLYTSLCPSNVSLLGSRG